MLFYISIAKAIEKPTKKMVANKSKVLFQIKFEVDMEKKISVNFSEINFFRA